MERTWIGLNKYGLQIHRFRVILGRRIQFRREKKIWDTPWARARSIFLTIGPLLALEVVQKKFLGEFEF